MGCVANYGVGKPTRAFENRAHESPDTTTRGDVDELAVRAYGPTLTESGVAKKRPWTSRLSGSTSSSNRHTNHIGLDSPMPSTGQDQRA